MKIGIIGTRGIPNNYGGFEQFAEQFSEYLVTNGHKVTVYNSSNHPFRETDYHGVKLIRKYDPEDKIGTTGQFIYDALCILDSRKQQFDIVLQLGYTSSSVFGFMLPSRALIFTNMDGLEWKRSKYNKYVQSFLKKAEKWAVKTSDYLIADSLGIKEYLKEKYNKSSYYIPYGAEIFYDQDSSILNNYKLKEFSYNLILARMEPENNIETITRAYISSKMEMPLVIIGNYNNSFGEYLINKYRNEKVQFLGAIYEKKTINNLRYFSNIYFHGHSVGGTNPSLIEAMGCKTFIVAHDNIFNKYILGNDACYFDSENTLLDILKTYPLKSNFANFINNNVNKVKEVYNPELIFKQLEELFLKYLNAK